MDAWQVNLVCLLEILLRLDFKVFQPHLKNMKDFHPKYNAKCNLSKLTDHDNTPNLPLLLAALLGLGSRRRWERLWWLDASPCILDQKLLW